MPKIWVGQDDAQRRKTRGWPHTLLKIRKRRILKNKILLILLSYASWHITTAFNIRMNLPWSEWSHRFWNIVFHDSLLRPEISNKSITKQIPTSPVFRTAYFVIQSWKLVQFLGKFLQILLICWKIWDVLWVRYSVFEWQTAPGRPEMTRGIYISRHSILPLALATSHKSRIRKTTSIAWMCSDWPAMVWLNDAF